MPDDQMKPSGPRLSFVALALATIALGLGLQWLRPELPLVFADVLGDALWALMIYWLIGAAAPGTPRLQRAAVALAVCWVVEFSQLYHTTWLDDWRATTMGHLTLGSGFDARDLAAYGLGVLVGIGLETTLLRQPRGAATSR